MSGGSLDRRRGCVARSAPSVLFDRVRSCEAAVGDPGEGGGTHVGRFAVEPRPRGAGLERDVPPRPPRRWRGRPGSGLRAALAERVRCGGGLAAGGSVSFGSNASDPVPKGAYAQVFKAYTAKTGTAVKVNLADRPGVRVGDRHQPVGDLQPADATIDLLDHLPAARCELLDLRSPPAASSSRRDPWPRAGRSDEPHRFLGGAV